MFGVNFFEHQQCHGPRVFIANFWRFSQVCCLPPAVKKNGKTKSETDVFSMKFDRTDLIIGQSKAKNCEESAGDVRIGVAPQKPSKKDEKRTKFCDKKERGWGQLEVL